MIPTKDTPLKTTRITAREKNTTILQVCVCPPPLAHPLTPHPFLQPPPIVILIIVQLIILLCFGRTLEYRSIYQENTQWQSRCGQYGGGNESERGGGRTAASGEFEDGSYRWVHQLDYSYSFSLVDWLVRLIG